MYIARTSVEGMESATTNFQPHMPRYFVSFFGSGVCLETWNVSNSQVQVKPMWDPEQGVADGLACVTRVTSLGFR
jgi:hypothetical protein